MTTMTIPQYGLPEDDVYDTEFDPSAYEAQSETKADKFGGDKFTLETISEEGKLRTFVGVWNSGRGKEEGTLVNKLAFKFRPGRKLPSKPTNDLYRMTVILRPRKKSKTEFGVCQSIKPTSSRTFSGYHHKTHNRYIGSAIYVEEAK